MSAYTQDVLESCVIQPVVGVWNQNGERESGPESVAQPARPTHQLKS